jgi:hypothetical protein
MLLRPEDGPAEPRSEGQRPLIWDDVWISQNFVVDRGAVFLIGLQRKKRGTAGSGGPRGVSAEEACRIRSGAPDGYDAGLSMDGALLPEQVAQERNFLV